MKTIALFGRGALLTASACLMLACDYSNGTSNQPSTAASPAANASLPSPAPTVEDLIPRLKPEEAKQLVDAGKAVIIDVRGADAYKAAHIKGALDVPLPRLEAGDFTGVPKTKRIIAYCSCGAEQTSKRAAEILEKAGFKGASALLGGNQAWEAAGYPMEKAAPANAAKTN